MKRILTIVTLLFLGLSVYAETNSDTVATDKSILSYVEDWYSANMNYGTITALMTIESSFIPFPSEVVIPPAAYVACNEGNDMNIILVVLFATLGSMLGAMINYLLSIWLGRPIIYKFADSKWGHLLALNGDKLKKAEDYFNEHGVVSTFIGRLIPVIRQLISIPAGLAKMKLPVFLLFTFLGAGIWNVILAALGYIAHGQQDLINQYSHEIGYVIVGVVVVVAIIYGLKFFIKQKKGAF